MNPQQPQQPLTNRICIFVDGENFRKSVLQKIFSDPYLRPSRRWSMFFHDLLYDAYGPRYSGHTIVRVYWYVAGSPSFKPKGIPGEHAPRATILRAVGAIPTVRSQINGKSEEDAERVIMKFHETLSQRRREFLAEFHQRLEIQDAILEDSASIEFRRAGVAICDVVHDRRNGESGVDVALAVGMIQFASIYDTAILISGDQDLVPAVQLVKDLGKKVLVPAFLDESKKQFPGLSAAIKRVADRVFQVSWHRVVSSFTAPGESIKNVIDSPDDLQRPSDSKLKE